MRNRLYSRIASLRSSKKTLLLIAVVATASIAITTTVSILLGKTTDLYIPSFGTVKTIGVEAYWDLNTENKTEKIDWGIVWVGSSQNVTLHIQSISNYKVTLTLNATDWIPANMSDYMTLSWDYNGTSLNPDEFISVTLILSTSYSDSFVHYLIDNDVQSFSFDIYIIAHEESSAHRIS